MKSKKLLILLAVIAVVLLAFFGIGKKVGWFGDEAYVKVAVEVGEKRNITEIITAPFSAIYKQLSDGKSIEVVPENRFYSED
ncbi:MAG: hypothetical protein WD577_05100 [Bacteroidales bacterium]